MYVLLSHLCLIDLALVPTMVPKTIINILSWKKDISDVGCGAQPFFYALAVVSPFDPHVL